MANLRRIRGRQQQKKHLTNKRAEQKARKVGAICIEFILMFINGGKWPISGRIRGRQQHKKHLTNKRAEQEARTVGAICIEFILMVIHRASR